MARRCASSLATSFQSTRPRGARLVLGRVVIVVGTFQSTRPRGARHLRPVGHALHPRFQSTRPRGARRGQRARDNAHRIVSIHAPAWGATRRSWWRGRLPVVSIHAPAWGATPPGIRPVPGTGVSIHAPAWGATPAGLQERASRPGFNPRARVGRDNRGGKGIGLATPFQSTRPRGARPSGWRHARLSAVGFNPRARVGRDPAGLQERASRPGFNPRARVGRDAAENESHGGGFKFQSTRPRGARRIHALPHLRSQIVSIHAPAWGATSIIAFWAAVRDCFNPRARVGRDQDVPCQRERFY